MPNHKIAEPEFPFRHRLPVQIRFNDIDMLGHLNNSIYLQFMDLGKAHYFRQFTNGPLNHDNLGVVVANINCDFYAPSFFEERLEVLTAVISMSEHSFKLEQRVVNADTAEVKCRAVSTMVNVDPSTCRAVEIDPAWRARLSSFEGRHF